MYDMIIIGAGPAGLSASIYAARKQLKILLISVDMGGQINNTLEIENYLGYQFIEGPELIDKFNTQIDKYSIEQIVGSKVTQIKIISGVFEIITDDSNRYHSKVVIFATGKKPKKLNIPGETKFTGRGVSYCAICDGPIFSKKRVAVVGGGNSALEAVLDLLKIAEHIDMISLTQFTGDQVLINKLKKAKNLDIYLEHRAQKIEGTVFVNSLTIEDLKNKKTKNLDVSGIFVEIGMVPNSEPLKKLIKLNDYGEVPINCACETELVGLFSAGDVTDVPEKQIVVAAGEGAKAALQAHRFLQRITK
ncbi:MAG: FAD-dependent oxidoreductase [Dehalococcoidia bacterium]|nr:MAG: FAD-dependent oxidoreductase [Dehalococcoidia bacterium]